MDRRSALRRSFQGPSGVLTILYLLLGVPPLPLLWVFSAVLSMFVWIASPPASTPARASAPVYCSGSLAGFVPGVFHAASIGQLSPEAQGLSARDVGVSIPCYTLLRQRKIPDRLHHPIEPPWARRKLLNIPVASSRIKIVCRPPHVPHQDVALTLSHAPIPTGRMRIWCDDPGWWHPAVHGGQALNVHTHPRLHRASSHGVLLKGLLLVDTRWGFAPPSGCVLLWC